MDGMKNGVICIKRNVIIDSLHSSTSFSSKWNRSFLRTVLSRFMRKKERGHRSDAQLTAEFMSA